MLVFPLARVFRFFAVCCPPRSSSPTILHDNSCLPPSSPGCSLFNHSSFRSVLRPHRRLSFAIFSRRPSSDMSFLEWFFFIWFLVFFAFALRTSYFLLIIIRFSSCRYIPSSFRDFFLEQVPAAFNRHHYPIDSRVSFLPRSGETGYLLFPITFFWDNLRDHPKTPYVLLPS